jgi:hypothetical protein
MKYRLTTASLRVLLIVSLGIGTSFTLTSCNDQHYRNGYHRGPAYCPAPYGHKVNRNRNGNWNRNPYNNPNRYRNQYRNPYRQGNARYGW